MVNLLLRSVVKNDLFKLLDALFTFIPIFSKDDSTLFKATAKNRTV